MLTSALIGLAGARPLSELAHAGFDRSRTGETFAFEGEVVFAPSPDVNNLAVTNPTGAVTLNYGPARNDSGKLRAGDVVAVEGVIRTDSTGQTFPDCGSVRILSHRDPNPPPAASIAELALGRRDNRTVRVCGFVRDAFIDEIDPRFTYAVLVSGMHAAYLATPNTDRGFLRRISGASVEVDGLCVPNANGRRMRLGRLLYVASPSSFRIVKEAEDPFAAPPLSEVASRQPAEIAALGRRRAAGRVLAVWNGNSVLAEAEDSTLQIELADGTEPPPLGISAEFSGLPSSDLYHINLVQSIWREASDIGVPDENPVDVRADDIATSDSGAAIFNPDWHGRLVRLAGTVRHIAAHPDSGRKISIDCGGRIVGIDASNCPSAADSLSVGCAIRATGRCILVADEWRTNASFPKIRDFFIVIRTPADIEIVAQPSPLTPGRMLALVGLLSAVILAVVVWNILLRRLAERRGRELADETVARIASDLKVYERTRLAVELHDSIAQNMTGIAMEVNTARRTLATDMATAREHLDIASRSIKSCSDDLRHCLWDLRSNTLENASIDEAIKATLRPHLGGAALSVRFNVPRERISDSAAHAILRIIRELTVNAVRHGRATSVKIAGSIEGDRLVFSVRDDGLGFDPDTCPGVAEGHYGLLGIRERIASLAGDMEISSSPGRGAKVVVSIKMPKEHSERLQTWAK